jgi:hypothetical protein
VLSFFLLPVMYGQNVGIGTSTPAGKLHIKGSSDTSQLVIDGNATQGKVPLIRLRKADGSDLLHIHADTELNAFFGITAGSHNNGGIANTFIGSNAGVNNVTGNYNTAIGRGSLFYSNYDDNTAVGFHSLFANVGYANTAVGSRALDDNSFAIENTAMGYGALRHNTNCNGNTAVGTDALSTQSYSLAPATTYYTHNTAIGLEALKMNNPTSASNAMNNTAVGSAALQLNTIGYNNTATGKFCLKNNTNGTYNTAVGAEALLSNGSGFNNTAVGYEALRSNTFNSYNTALGYRALNNSIGSANTAVGSRALYSLTSGAFNTALGDDALYNCTTGSYNIGIGEASGVDAGTPGVSNTVSIGNHGWLNAASNQVFLGNGSTLWIGGWKNWSVYSDGRIKSNIAEDVKGLEFINRLRPVTYYTSLATATVLTGNKEVPGYTGKYDCDGIKQSGFIAQEVEAAALKSGYHFGGVRKPQNERDLYSISYASMVVPLVKAVQEQQQLIDDKQKQIDELKARLDKLEKLLMK